MKLQWYSYDKHQNQPLHNVVVDKLAAWSAEAPHIKPITREALTANRLGVIGLSKQLTLLGHAAITHYEDGQAILGGLVVNPQYRQVGFGHTLVGVCLQQLANKEPETESCIAYANDTSRKLFSAMGGILLGIRQPPESSGCNWIYDLSPILNQERQS